MLLFFFAPPVSNLPDKRTVFDNRAWTFPRGSTSRSLPCNYLQKKKIERKNQYTAATVRCDCQRATEMKPALPELLPAHTDPMWQMFSLNRYQETVTTICSLHYYSTRRALRNTFISITMIHLELLVCCAANKSGTNCSCRSIVAVCISWNLLRTFAMVWWGYEYCLI